MLKRIVLDGYTHALVYIPVSKHTHALSFIYSFALAYTFHNFHVLNLVTRIQLLVRLSNCIGSLTNVRKRVVSIEI